LQRFYRSPSARRAVLRNVILLRVSDQLAIIQAAWRASSSMRANCSSDTSVVASRILNSQLARHTRQFLNSRYTYQYC
jgi:hypothetical protein